MRIKVVICIAIMLTVILGVDVIAFAALENVTTKDNINLLSSKNEEFENQGTTTPKVVVSASHDKLENRRYIVNTSVISIVTAVILYFSGKVLAFLRLTIRYQKAIKDGKKVDKPKVEIKLKYFFALFIIIDVLLWAIIICMKII